MRVGVGSDHAGYALKAPIVRVLEEMGNLVVDYGTYSTEPVDYPDYAGRVAGGVISGEVDRGIIVCGSGVGASVAANKVHGIRAGVCHDVYSAHQGVEHDDMNVLCLGARVIGPALAEEIVVAFARAQFSGAERHLRRLAKIAEMEATGAPINEATGATIIDFASANREPNSDPGQG